MSQFTVNYPGDKTQLLSKIKNTVGDKGSLAGNEQEGTFEGDTMLGKFEGKYSIDGDDITITIDKKPFFLSTDMIQDEFKKALNKP